MNLLKNISVRLLVLLLPIRKLEYIKLLNVLELFLTLINHTDVIYNYILHVTRYLAQATVILQLLYSNLKFINIINMQILFNR